MSTTPTSVEIPVQRWSVKQYAVLVALTLALMAGAFGVYSLSSPNEATTAPSTTLIEDGRDRSVVPGGLRER